MEEEGVNFAKASVLDPAAGGAAFLSMVAGRMKELGCAPKNILRRIKGIELDPMLAELARKLIAERLGLAAVPTRTVIVKDALQTKISKQYDVVLANPPYGRVFPNQIQIGKYSDVCHPGCINKYAPQYLDLRTMVLQERRTAVQCQKRA
jgi:adenine-specific DNA-methyltransferase